jgi:hypothetical protein
VAPLDKNLRFKPSLCVFFWVQVIADSFPQLQVLKLSNLRIEEWKEEKKGGMPSLRHLVVKCDDLAICEGDTESKIGYNASGLVYGIWV